MDRQGGTGRRWCRVAVAIAGLVVLFTAAGLALLLAGVRASSAQTETDFPNTPGIAVVVRPVSGAVVRAFDPPEHPYGPGHRCADLAADPGEPVRAALAGVVTFSGEVAGRGWVTVDHGGGLRTTYGVLPTREVRAGQRVRAGEIIGFVSEDAEHLDWGARLHGSYVDPLALFGRWEAHLIHPDRLIAPVREHPSPPPVAGTAGPEAIGGAPATMVWPVPGRISSGFGMRTHPITGQRRLHAGVDVAASTGTPIVAAAAGVVRTAGPRGGYGNLVVVDHGGGLETRYAHASALAVHPGHQVNAGHLLAWVGSTGLSTGPHLHFEVRVGGTPRDPLSFY
jgi:murein DD-endopeptidase MepM/ murein hydrolase activator NlpD